MRSLRSCLLLAALACTAGLTVVPSASGQPTGRIRISASTSERNLLTKVEPVYPPGAAAAHVSGSVVLHAIITAEGTVDKLEVISGPEMLRTAALQAVSQWVYKPYLLNGTATAVDTTVVVNFNLVQ